MKISGDRVILAASFVVAVLCGAAIGLGTFAGSVSIEALANIGVAAGTLALAYFTWRSVRKTSELISGEDRRHQQGFVPLIGAPPPLCVDAGVRKFYFEVENQGHGPALRVRLHLIAKVELSFSYLKEDRSAVVWASEMYDHKKLTYDVDGNFEIALLAANRRGAMFSTDEIVPMAIENNAGRGISSARVGGVEYLKASLAYLDLFGNEYRLEYSDFAKQIFDFVQPASLSAPSGE